MKFGEKRAQVSTFMVVAILILVLGGLLIYSGQLGPNKSKEVVSEQAALGSAASSVNVFVNSCLKQESDKAIGKHGFLVPFSEISIRDDVEAGVVGCTAGFESFAAQGIKVSAGTPRAVVSIQPTVVAVSLSYPLTITEGGKRSSVSGFSYTYQRDKSLQLGSSGQVAKTSVLASQDKKAELLFAQGIVITDYNGNPVTSYAIKELDREDVAFPQNVVSARVYDLTPGEFSGPVKITLAYPEDYENPEELYVAWWDAENSLWHGVPTTRDLARKTVSAELEHATGVTVTKCKDAKKPLPSIQALVFEQTCGRTGGAPASGKDAAGKDVSGSNIKGSCADSAATTNLWVMDAEGLHLKKLDKTSADFAKASAVAPHTDIPEGQLSRECKVKSWGTKDVSGDDINKCGVSNIPQAQLDVLNNKFNMDAKDRCVQKCIKSVKDDYGSLYDDNLPITGGDGLVDGSKCECAMDSAGNDLECTTKTISNAPVAGYEGWKQGEAAGYGVLKFYIQPGSCVVYNADGTPQAAVYVSDQDPIFTVKDAQNKPYQKAYTVVDNTVSPVKGKKTIAPKHYVINPAEADGLNQDFVSFLRRIDNVKVTGLEPKGAGLKSGWNRVYFLADHIKKGTEFTGCSHLWVDMELKGLGISPTEGVSWSDCTVQQRIAFLEQNTAELNEKGVAELEALRSFKGGTKWDATPNSKKKLGEARIEGKTYEAAYLNEETGAPIGCGSITSQTDMELRLRQQCTQIPNGRYCDNEQPSVWFTCASNSLASHGNCNDNNPGTVCSKGTANLGSNGYSSTDNDISKVCVKPENSGCFYDPAQYPFCVEAGKPEMYTCENNIRKEGREAGLSCAAGNCYFNRCGENVCAAATTFTFFYCDGNKYYKCDGKGAIAKDSDGNEVRGECGQGETCVNGADATDKVCASSQPKCTKDKIQQTGKWFCDPTQSSNVYNCDGGKLQTLLCPSGNVCVKEGEAYPTVCGEPRGLNDFCEDKPEDAAGLTYPAARYYCSGNEVVQCYKGQKDFKGVLAQTKGDLCKGKCITQGTEKPEDVCLYPESKRGKFECVEAGKPNLRSYSKAGDAVSYPTCPENQVCTKTGDLQQGINQICKSKFDQLCTGKDANKIYCKSKGKESGYFICNPADPDIQFRYREGSCEAGKLCMEEGKTKVEEACGKPTAQGCKAAGDFCVANRKTAGFYTCTEPEKGKFERTDSSCPGGEVCCGAGGSVRCGACNSCYWQEPDGPDTAGAGGGWYAQESVVCSSKLDSAHKCAGGLNNGWGLKKTCDAAKGEVCIAEKQGCVLTCNKADLEKDIKDPAKGGNAKATITTVRAVPVASNYYFTGNVVCVDMNGDGNVDTSDTMYECVPSTIGTPAWVNRNTQGCGK